MNLMPDWLKILLDLESFTNQTQLIVYCKSINDESFATKEGSLKTQVEREEGNRRLSFIISYCKQGLFNLYTGVL